MKLLSATSFLLFLIITLLLVSCDLKNDEFQNTDSQLLKKNDSIVKEKIKNTELDSAIVYLHEKLKFSRKINNEKHIKKTLMKLESVHRKNNTYDSAIFYADKLYETAKYYQDTLHMARARSRRALNYKNKQEFRLSYKDYLDAKELYLSIADSINVGRKLNEIANLEKKLGNLETSQVTALEGLKYSEPINDIRTLSGLYYIIAVAAKEDGDFEIAKKRIDQALSLTNSSIGAKKINLKDRIEFYNTKANIYKETEKFDSAIKIYEDLLIDNKDKLHKKQEARIYGNLAHTLFLKEGFNKRSDSLLKKSLAMYKEIGYYRGLHSISLKLAELYKSNDKLVSTKYVNDALEYAREFDNENSIYEALELKISLDFSSDDWKEFIDIGKRIKFKDRASESLIANAKFDFEKEENEKIKAKNRLIVAENKTSQSRNLLLILLLIFIVVLVLIFFIYQKIKRRHKIEKVKTVHNTEVRISTKVHDELANDIHYLLAQLETSNPNKEAVLDKLDIIYNNARDISKQNRSVETGEGFPDELANLFRSYQSDEVNVILKRYDIDIWNGISEHIKVTLYRVLQELLTNMKKHSNATLVAVSIEKYKKELFVQFKDNGKGFSEGISKNGLLNAENRIHAIKGKLTFDTELHQGCKFSINVPL